MSSSARRDSALVLGLSVQAQCRPDGLNHRAVDLEQCSGAQTAQAA